MRTRENNVEEMLTDLKKINAWTTCQRTMINKLVLETFTTLLSSILTECYSLVDKLS